MLKIIILTLAVISISALKLGTSEHVGKGSAATCPNNLTPVSCACGNRCGSYHTAGNTCHCQCGGMDWTAAHCLSMADSKNQVINYNTQRVQAMGKQVSCPAGFKATGCSCGSTCGTWDIKNEVTCNCHCGEWTAAICAKPANSDFEMSCRYRVQKGTQFAFAEAGFAPVACSCGEGCGSFSIIGNKCWCHPGCGSSWTAINECKLVQVRVTPPKPIEADTEIDLNFFQNGAQNPNKVTIPLKTPSGAQLIFILNGVQHNQNQIKAQLVHNQDNSDTVYLRLDALPGQTSSKTANFEVTRKSGRAVKIVVEGLGEDYRLE